MAVTATPALPQAINNTVTSFIQGTDAAGTFKTIFTAGSNGSKVVAVLVNTTDGTATHVLTLQVKRSSTGYPLINYTLPINSGGDGSTASVDMFAGGPAGLLLGLPVDNDGQKYLLLKSGDTLELTFATALTSGKNIYVHVIGADF